MKPLKTFLISAVISTAIALLWFHFHKPKPVPLEKILIADGSQPAGAILYAAIDKGFLKKEGLQPVFQHYSYGKPALEAVLTEQADFATVAETPFTNAVLQGREPRLIATLGEADHYYAILSLPEAGIRRPEDLRRKKIGLPEGTGAEQFLYLVLNLSGLLKKDVEIVNVAPDEMEQALRERRVDAVCIWENIITNLKKKFGPGLVSIGQENNLPLFWNIVTRKQLMDSRPELAEKLLRAVKKGGQWCRKNENECMEITGIYSRTEMFDLKKLWKNNHIGLGLNQLLILSCENHVRQFLMKREKAVMPNILDYIDITALKKTAPEEITLIQ